jgi:hypothetical protein
MQISVDPWYAIFPKLAMLDQKAKDRKQMTDLGRQRTTSEFTVPAMD